MSDQVESGIMDSDIKFQCRLLLTILEICRLPKEIKIEFLGPISEIVRLENKRLRKLRTTEAKDPSDMWPEIKP